MEQTNDMMSSKEINKKIFSMILPITIESLLQMIAGIVLMGMIGHIDVVAVSALGISMRITQIIWALFKGITIGASVFVAQAYGAKNFKKLSSVIQQTILSSLVLVLFLEAIVYFKANALLSVFNPSSNLLSSGVLFLKIVSFGLPFLAIMLIVGGVLQGMGNAKTPMYITLIMNLVNIICGYVLIFGKFGFSPMGIKGAGIATVMSEAIAAIIGIYILFKKNGVMSCYLNKSFFNFNLKEILLIYKVGIPSALESILWQIAAIILTRAILTFGEVAFAAHQLGMQAEAISYMPAMGFGVAATTFVGQALGGKDKNLAKTYLRQIMKGAMLITVISVLILILFPKQMMSLLTNNNEVVKLGAIYLFLMGLVQFPQNAQGVLLGAMRGAGRTKAPMIIAGSGLWGVRVPLTLLFTYTFKFSIISIWIAMCIDLVFRFLFCFILYKKQDIYENTLSLNK